MAVSGLWMARNAEVNPMYGPYTVASRRHAEDEGAPAPVQGGMINAPSYQGTDGQVPTFTATDPGVPLASEPKSHLGVRRSPGMNENERGAVHSQDFGMVDRKDAAKGPLRFHDDAWHITLTEDMDAPPAARGAEDRPDLVRGLNAFGQNNPPKPMFGGHGWRHALSQKTWFTHNLRAPRLRPRFRATWPEGAAPRTNVPGTQRSIYDGTSYGTLDRSRRNNYSRPTLRRIPGPIDETIVRDRWTGGQAPVADVM